MAGIMVLMNELNTERPCPDCPDGILTGRRARCVNCAESKKVIHWYDYMRGTRLPRRAPAEAS